MQATEPSHPSAPPANLKEVSSRLAPPLAVVGMAGLGVAFVLGLLQGDGLRYFLGAYLINYCYFLSISLGGLFFVALGHATRAGWSVTTRRLFELIAANVPCLAILCVHGLSPMLTAHRGLRWAVLGLLAWWAGFAWLAYLPF